MNHADLLVLFDHLYWIRDRILDTADDTSVPFTERTAPTVRDLRATLVHELDVEWSWRQRLRRDDRTTFPPDDAELVPDDFPTIEAIRAHWLRDEVEMRDWIVSMTDAQLAGPCRAETQGTHPLWFHLHHLYAHGLQQFANAAVILSLAGRSPGDLDFLDFLDFLRQRDLPR